jgi:hypothetical protein
MGRAGAVLLEAGLGELDLPLRRSWRFIRGCGPNMEVEKMDKSEYLDKYEGVAHRMVAAEAAAEKAAKEYIDVLEHEGPSRDCMAARMHFEQMTTPWLVLELIAAKRELDALKPKSEMAFAILNAHAEKKEAAQLQADAASHLGASK